LGHPAQRPECGKRSVLKRRRLISGDRCGDRHAFFREFHRLQPRIVPHQRFYSRFPSGDGHSSARGPSVTARISSRPNVPIRHVIVDGRRASLRLEAAIWEALHEVAGCRGLTVRDLVAEIDRKREHQGLTAAIRVYIVEFYRAELNLSMGRRGTGFSKSRLQGVGPFGAANPLARSAEPSGFLHPKRMRGRI